MKHKKKLPYKKKVLVSARSRFQEIVHSLDSGYRIHLNPDGSCVFLEGVSSYTLLYITLDEATNLNNSLLKRGLHYLFNIQARTESEQLTRKLMHVFRTEHNIFADEWEQLDEEETRQMYLDTHFYYTK